MGFYSEKDNVDFSSSTSVLSEKKDLKRDFPREQHPTTQILSGDVSDRSSVAVQNIKAFPPQREILPRADILDAGIPCQSRTSASSKAASNMNCAQAGKELTGLGW